MITRRSLLTLSAGAAAASPLFASPDAARAIFTHVNELRAARGVAPLAWADDVARCAVEHCERKIRLRFPGHEDPERGGVSERLDRAGVRWWNCAENVFQMCGYEEIAEFAVVFWWYSLGHQRNMVSVEYDETGVGVTRADDGTWFATQIFVRRRQALLPPLKQK